MAITRAQIARELYKNGKRVGLKGGADAATASFGKSVGYSDSKTGSTGRPDGDLNVGAGGASFNSNDTPQSLNVPSSDYVSPVTGTVDPTGKEKFKYDKQFYDKGDLSPSQSRLSAIKRHNIQKRINYRKKLMDNNLKLLNGANVDNALGIEAFGPDGTKKYSQEFIDAVLSGERPPPQFFNEIDPNAIPTLAGKGITAVANFFGKKMAGPVTQEEIDRIMKEQVALENFDPTKTTFDDMMKTYEPNRYSRENDLVYNRITGEFTPKPNDGGGDNNYIPPIIPEEDTTEEEDATSKRNLGGLAPRFAGSIFDFTGLADGGRAGAMDGGRMMMANQEEDDPEGGIMDLESGRQMYFLGKLVKKATRAVKKIAKSPVGKMALLGLGAGYAGFGPAKGLFSGMKGAGFLKNMAINKSLLGTPDYMGGPTGIFDFIKSNPYKTIGGLSLFSGLMTPKEEEENNDDYYKTNSLNIADIRNNPYNFLSARNQGSRFAADGGLMRTGYAEGSKEPVAKKTMPLLDMDGQEMDLREEGGFVPLGRMERADDVPARLSKNEFVFTADAVRNAGEGDVDKGAEVMYNMMKNLESGGEVSEESQGLDGAREMFKTSQRLEEVI